mgnify:CR=1 FL=1
MTSRPVLLFSLGAVTLPFLPVAPMQAQTQPSDFENKRLLMRQLTQQLQGRLEQRLRCVNQAKTLKDLETCQRTTSLGWHHGAGMGSWTCPIW